MRVLKEETSIKNDIYFLITDGEEQGLLGAKQFVANNPEMKEKVSLVINFEARGNEGALLMFETSEKNKNIVKQFARAVGYKTAFSFSAEVYKKMPNDTDLSVFLQEGYTGMNFAMIGGAKTYHNELDTYENLSRGSAWQYMETAVDLVKYYKDADLSKLEGKEDAVYFPILPGNIVIISGVIMKILAFVCAVGMLARAGYLIFVERIQPGQTALGFGIVFLTVIISGAGAYVIHLFFNRFGWNIYLQWIIAIILGGFGITAAYILIDTKEAIITAVGLVFAILSVVTALFFNSASYLFTLPLLILLLVPIFVFKDKRKTIGDSVTALVGAVCECIFMTILYIPVLYVGYLAFGASIGFALTSLFVLASFPIAALYFGYIECMKDIRR